MSEKKPLVKLLPDLNVEEFHLPINTGKVRITEEQDQASCRWVEIKMKQSVPSFSIDKPRNFSVNYILANKNKELTLNKPLFSDNPKIQNLRKVVNL